MIWDGAFPLVPLDNHCREDGSLPSGQELSEQFGRKSRWGRLVKQRGEQGLLGAAA